MTLIVNTTTPNRVNLNLPGYCILNKIYDGSRTVVFRGQRESDQINVIIKLLKNAYPTFPELIQFRNQYTIAKEINVSGIVKPYSLERYNNGLAIVMEDFGGVALSHTINQRESSQTTSLQDFFNIAIQLTHILEGLYQNRVIHKDIKPHNILLNPDTFEVRLIDFSIASRLPRESQSIQSPHELDGTLAYMSPEQTGRMNRGLDYRTDFYSLGVTFYELLVGQLPFQSNDAIELVHCHIAQMPKPPCDLNTEIPEMVSDIVLKLMSKTAEERYQSAYGLRHDLESCYQQWQTQGSIKIFPLGARDISDCFVIPEKLYGRDQEVKNLLSAFDRVSQAPQDRDSSDLGQSELVLVAGFSGIGKTAVVNEVHKPIVRQRGYFIKGKFDQFQRNVPLSAFVTAFRDLMAQLLMENQTQVDEWRKKILAAVGKNGQVIIDVIPEVELLIGPQPPVDELEASASQNRFNLLFQQFVRVFPSVKHPLVLFIDDLQWADTASLKLIEGLMNERDLHHLLLIGAYRDNEVSTVHPLMQTIAGITKSGAMVNTITLPPLTQMDLNLLIADTLHAETTITKSLTELVHSKTKGNPFFSNQFLNALHEDGLITFRSPQFCEHDAMGQGVWQCDMEKIRALSLTDDVVEFMSLQLQRLSPEVQAVLKLAACIGSEFDLKTLSVIHEKSTEAIANALWLASSAGLILPKSEAYKFFQAGENQIGTLQLQVTHDQVPTYKFLHDRVQQAAYNLIPADQIEATHLKIGKLLLHSIAVEEREEKIFNLVNHLNRGVTLISCPAEREELARLNLLAGRKALATTAYVAAFESARVAIGLLQPDGWRSHYQMMLALHEVAAEAAYLRGEFEQMEAWLETMFLQAKTNLDCVKAYEVKIQAYTSQNQLLEAIAIARKALQEFDITFPDAPREDDIKQAFQSTAGLVAQKNIETLINLPLMTAAEHLASMRIVLSMIPASYLAAPNLCPLLILSQVNASICYGNAPASAFFYASYGFLLNGVLQDIDTADQFGKLAASLASKCDSKEIKTRTLFVLGAFIIHGKSHIREAVSVLLEGYQTGLESGNFEFVGYCAKELCQSAYLSGQELMALEPEIKAYAHQLSSLEQTTTSNYCQIYWRAVLNLLGRTDDPCLLSSQEKASQENLLSSLLEANDLTGLHYFFLHQLILCYLFENSSQALENAAQTRHYLAAGIGFITVPIFHFYDSLAILAAYDEAQSESEQLFQQVIDNQTKMQRWSHYAPMNYLHKFYLVEAERYRVLEKYLNAMEMYDRAIALAREADYLHEEALANELAAKFYLRWGKEKIAQTYLIDAYYSYSQWGASAKVKDLEKRYPDLLISICNRAMISSQVTETRVSLTERTMSATSDGQRASHHLDLVSVMKASQAISEEIHLERLRSTLMRVVMENAGAQRGMLILSMADILVIVAQAVDEHLDSILQPLIPIQESQDIPLTMVNYVDRTAETLILDQATAEATFAADPYIIEQQPKSVLCMPILKQGKRIGILYLENNLTIGAFKGDCLRILKLLCTQAAISLENANLYLDLQQSESDAREKSQQLEKSLQELRQAQDQLMQTTEQLEHDAFHDALTELPNRRWFMHRVEHLIRFSGNQRSHLYAVLLIDLDDFKVVNDSLGHILGDELLKHVAHRLDNCLRSTDTIARLGGDEFAILLERVNDVDEVTRITDRIQKQLTQPFALNGHEVFSQVSIGIALNESKYERPEDLLRDADTAMYHAKAMGKGRYSVFVPAMQTQLMTRLRLERDLRRALELQEFCLHYQPIVSLSTGHLIGFEALMRWYHPSQGWISPAEFIPIAEETGLINAMGLWALEAACHQLKLWQNQLRSSSSLVMNVNLSAQQLKPINLVEQIRNLLQEQELNPSCLKLEITESCILESVSTQAKLLGELRELGLKLCIDDFGTGYSSLSRLHEFPIDTLKIDRAFVRRIDSSTGGAQIIQTIVSLAHSLGMDVVAEGIETPAQLAGLQTMGCELGQGYLFSKPVDSTRATELVAELLQAASLL
ncbi:MAG: EAL domain-containing protein, partial [Cyanothece sp. SIO1E1]|nr:EAL domain-containing protein [Cyanothece sp. SIO1E1]